MDEEQEKPEPKLHAPVIVLGFVTFVVFDLIGLIPFVSDFLDPIFIVVVVVLALGKIGGGLALGVNFLAVVAEFIPVVQELPFYTIAWAVTVAADRNQKVKAVVETTVATAGAANTLSGAGGTVGGATQVPGEIGDAGRAVGGATQVSGEVGDAGRAVGGGDTAPARSGRPTETSTERKPDVGRPSESPRDAGAQEGGAAQKPEISAEALGEQPTPFEEMEKTFKETPTETPKPATAQEEGMEPQSRIGKVNEDIKDKLNRYGIQEQESSGPSEGGLGDEEADDREAAT